MKFDFIVGKGSLNLFNLSVIIILTTLGVITLNYGKSILKRRENNFEPISESYQRV